MKKAMLFALLLAAAGCDKSDQANNGDKSVSKDSALASADNTKKNERDRDSKELTPGDQGESEGDRTITQQIRKSLVKSDALSMTAKNVKVITVDAKVTLRGPVKSDQEKTDIGDIATKTAGVKSVDNQLEIAAK